MICAADTNLTLVGLMSGTSLDGIDAAVISVLGAVPDARISYRGFRSYPYPPDARERLTALASGEPATPGEIALASYALGRLYGDAVLSCLEDLRIDPADVDAVACHGQTIFHQGTPANLLGVDTAATMQIGEPSVIAERTGLRVVSDFRSADMAAGGQGAPLVPLFDYVFLRDVGQSRAAQNIGGIANVTYLPAGCGIDDVIAFDNGPGNMLIDAAVSRFTRGELACDLDGLIARRGRVMKPLLSRLMAHSFYAQPPPKSAGREQFGVHYLEELLTWPETAGARDEDLVATLTALAAESIAASYRSFLPGAVDEIVISGGGANNPVLIEMIKRAVAAPVVKFDSFGIPSGAKEAAAFALLASETLRGRPGNVPSATGARRAVVLGKITPRD